PARDDPANSPTGFRNVASIAWNDMQVCVVDGLARGRSHVHPEVVTLRVMIAVEYGAHLANKTPYRSVLVLPETEEIGLVSPRDNQGVFRCQWEPIGKRGGHFVACDHSAALDELTKDATHETSPRDAALRCRRHEAGVLGQHTCRVARLWSLCGLQPLF